MVRDQQEIKESKESFDNTIILQPKEETWRILHRTAFAL